MRTSKGICKVEWDRIKKKHLKFPVLWKKKTNKNKPSRKLLEDPLVETFKNKHIHRNILNMTNTCCEGQD